MSCRSIIHLLFALALTLSASASPLDDRIKAFNDAAVVQDENAITQILKTGVQEKRSAEALLDHLLE